MPAVTIRWSLRKLLLLILVVPALGLSEEAQEGAQCLPDEVDMGDYCMKLAETAPGADDDQRRVTRFPARSLMPGRIDMKAQPMPEAVPKAAELPVIVLKDSPPAPVVAEGGYGIQFGAFSTRAAAVRAAIPVREQDTGVVLSPAERGDRTLWIALAGPFASEAEARSSLRRLQAAAPMDDAWVKPLKGMTLEGISHDPSPQ